MNKSQIIKIASAVFFIACGLLLSAQTTGRPVNSTTIELNGGGCGVSDNGPAIQAAANSAATVLEAGACTYRVVTPVVWSKRKFKIKGAGRYITHFDFEPGADATLFKIDGSGGQTYEHDLRDFSIISSDTTHTKTAIRFIDASSVTVYNISCSRTSLGGGLWTGGTGSICLQTNGRDTSTFQELEFDANKPIVILDNPNVYLSADHYVFRDVYLVGDSTGPCITSTAPLTNISFVGRQAWTACAGGIKSSASPTYPTASWNNVTIEDVRTEQTPTPGALSIEINPGGSTNLRGLWINNWQSGMGGIKLRQVLGGTIANGQASCSPTAQILDIDTSSDQITLLNNRLEAACTASIGSMIAANVVSNPTGSTVPAHVTYLSAARGIIALTPLAFASLPTCNAANKGARGFITDGNSATYRTASAGGGATNIAVLCDGTSWLND